MPQFPIQQLLDDLARSLAPEEFDAAAAHSLAAFDSQNSEAIGQKGLKLACREGCSLCCSLRVDVFAHEVFLIARHIRSHFSDGEIAAVLDRLAAHAAIVMPLTPFEHATRNTVCPLLQDGSCTVYAVRPHSCRRHHSQDFAACQFTFDHPTDIETPAAHDRDLFRALTEAMRENISAYADIGYDATFYELGTALKEALSDPSSWSRWRDRGRAFLRASVTPVE